MLQKNEIPLPWGEGGESFCQSGKVLLGCLVGFGREMCLVWGFFWGGRGKGIFCFLYFKDMIFSFVMWWKEGQSWSLLPLSSVHEDERLNLHMWAWKITFSTHLLHSLKNERHPLWHHSISSFCYRVSSDSFPAYQGISVVWMSEKHGVSIVIWSIVLQGCQC